MMPAPSPGSSDDVPSARRGNGVSVVPPGKVNKQTLAHRFIQQFLPEEQNRNRSQIIASAIINTLLTLLTIW